MERSVQTNIRDAGLISERHQDIVKAATVVFLEKGFHIATTHDVAKRANLSQSNLYNYVKTKSDILFMVCESIVGRYELALDNIEKNAQDARMILIKSVKSIISIMYDRRSELRLLYNEVHSLGPRDRKLIMSKIASLNARFEDLIESYELSGSKIEIGNRRLAANLISFTPVIVSLRAWDLADISRKEQEASVLEFMLGGLGIAK